MNFNTDGFNERTNYIHNSNDKNRLGKNSANSFDNSFAQMRVDERKTIVETTNQDKIFIEKDVRGNKDKFLLRNNSMRQVNLKKSTDNPVSRALDKNMFKR